MLCLFPVCESAYSFMYFFTSCILPNSQSQRTDRMSFVFLTSHNHKLVLCHLKKLKSFRSTKVFFDINKKSSIATVSFNNDEIPLLYDPNSWPLSGEESHPIRFLYDDKFRNRRDYPDFVTGISPSTLRYNATENPSVFYFTIKNIQWNLFNKVIYRWLISYILVDKVYNHESYRFLKIKFYL